MNDELITYLSSMHVAKRMLRDGIIDVDDYVKIEERIALERGIKKGSAYRLNSLIIKDLRAIYDNDTKEVKDGGD